MATNSPEEQGEASSTHFHPRKEASRSHDDQVDQTTPHSSLEIHASPQNFKCWEDPIEDSEIEDFVYEPERPSSLRSQAFDPGDADYVACPSPSGGKCPASFGDNGVTATAGGCGQLLQFSAYLGVGNSGMFSVGHRYTDWPYAVTTRLKNLMQLASESFDNAQRRTDNDFGDVFGLKFLNLKSSPAGYRPPRLKWLQYRWPRYEYQGSSFEGMSNVYLTIQLIVREKTVIQKSILENRGNGDVTLELAFCKNMRISDLDHVTDNYEFNNTTSNQQNAGPGPGGLSWVHVNRVYEGSPGTQTGSEQSSQKRSSPGGAFIWSKGRSAFGVAAVASIAVNGKMIRFCPAQSPHTWKEVLKAKSKLEIITAYKLVLLAIPSYVSYDLDWRKFVFPLKEMNTNHFFRGTSAVPLFRTPITRISRTDDFNKEDKKRDPESLKQDDSENEANILNVLQEEVATDERHPQTKPLPALAPVSTLGKTSPVMDRIEFTVRRNLQHILDVCAIPVGVRLSGADPGDVVWRELNGVQAIALSCGDLSGHRISTASSFFAFQFIAEVAKRLRCLPQPDRDDSQVQALLSRIRDVCLGHLKWLYVAENNDQQSGFGSLYWASGEAVTLPESSDSWAPSDHVRDTALQILKAMGFLSAFTRTDGGDPLLGRQLIRQWGRDWVQWLERQDRRESNVWCHREDQDVKAFRLDDQVWIWRALKAVEDEIYEPWGNLDDGAQHWERRSSEGSEALDAHRSSRTSRKFSSWTIQREALLKFTTDHEIMRQKMIALSRSPRETRFLFHARDTALLYGEDMGFFPGDATFQKAWKSTIDVQRFHENNQDAGWDNTLRYALSIMLGIRGHQINHRKPGDMVRVATDVLLRSSGENGLFPGRLDIMAKSPMNGVFHREQDADSCYEASFEIPYIFLAHSQAIEDVGFYSHSGSAVEKPSEDANFSHDPTTMAAHQTSNPQEQIHPKEDGDLRELGQKLSNVLEVLTSLPKSTSFSGVTRSEERSGDAPLALKKSLPFSNIIDSNNIVEIEDEWLFNYPDFFGAEGDDFFSIGDTLDSVERLDTAWLKSIDITEMRQKYSSYNNKDGRGDYNSTSFSYFNSSSESPSYHSWPYSESSSYQNSSISSESPMMQGGGCGLEIMDVASRKLRRRKGRKDATRTISGSFEVICEHLRRPRNAAKAKKRMIGWDRPNTDLELEAALLCYSASNGQEKKNMLKFFARHFQHENFIYDHCIMAYNTWETEVHLSFFTLGTASGSLSGDAPLNFERFPGVQGTHLSRGSVGMRFHGDAFDRYWTLHYFCNVDGKVIKDMKNTTRSGVSSLTPVDYMVESGQRKILELILFTHMLILVQCWTQKILAKIKSEMGIKSGAFDWSTPSMDTYSSWHRIWEGFAPLLQALADDLISAQDVAGQWEKREGSRGQDRPRWTRNDEKKYRTGITEGQRMLELSKKGIQNALDEIDSLRDVCTNRLANAREELAFRSSQNIASFTYVTIVFLPLGFAASVFSMNGYPDTGWVASMTVIAVVTLVITAIALANAKLLLGVAEQLSSDALKFTGTVFQSSIKGRQKRQHEYPVQGSTGMDEPSNRDPKAGEPLEGRTWRYVLFWIAYLLIELPARRVALACRELPSSLWKILSSKRPDARSAGSGGSTDNSSTASATPGLRKSMRIAGGILLLPLLFFSWTIQLFFYNVLDMLVCLGRLIRRTVYDLVILSDVNGATSDTKILTWLIDPPPSLRPMRNFMRGNQEDKVSSAEVDESVASERTDTSPNQEV